MTDKEDKPLPTTSALQKNSDGDYRRMVEAINDYAIFFLDPRGHVVSWNAGAQKIKGYKPDEIIGKHFSTFYPPELLNSNWPQYELEVATEKGRFEDEGWRIRKDGTRFWANIIITKMINADGEFIGFSKITRDISERRRQEELLRASEERFRLLVEGVTDYAIFMLDPSGHIISWNLGAYKNTGYTTNEIIGKHFSVFYAQDVAASGWPDKELQLTLKDGRFEHEGWRIRKDGSRFWANVLITALYDEHGSHRGFAKITRDMTEKRKISKLEDESRRINEFLAMLGHELRNPLAPISNALAIMEMEKIESASVCSMRDLISRQVKQITRLVDDLLDVSRITSGKIHLDDKLVKLANVITESVETSEPLIKAKSHSLKIDIEDHDLWISGDRARLVQIFSNLLNNAAKFTTTNGQILLHMKQNNAFAEICVKDNGPGISDSLMPHIFKLFVQGEQDLAHSQGGLGLGLNLAKQLVELHSGEINAYSMKEPEVGSEFVVRLPLAKAPNIRSLNRTIEKGARKKVLVVDDNRDAADTLGALLQNLGYESVVMYDGITGLDSIRNDPPDMVLLDIGLPGLSGIDIAKKISKEINNPPPIIAITGYGQDRDREASLKAGFYAHLIKPLDIAKLSMLLKKLLS